MVSDWSETTLENSRQRLWILTWDFLSETDPWVDSPPEMVWSNLNPSPGVRRKWTQHDMSLRKEPTRPSGDMHFSL